MKRFGFQDKGQRSGDSIDFTKLSYLSHIRFIDKNVNREVGKIEMLNTCYLQFRKRYILTRVPKEMSFAVNSCNLSHLCGLSELLYR